MNDLPHEPQNSEQQRTQTLESRSRSRITTKALAAILTLIIVIALGAYALTSGSPSGATHSTGKTNGSVLPLGIFAPFQKINNTQQFNITYSISLENKSFSMQIAHYGNNTRALYNLSGLFNGIAYFASFYEINGTGYYCINSLGFGGGECLAANATTNYLNTSYIESLSSSMSKYINVTNVQTSQSSHAGTPCTSISENFTVSNTVSISGLPESNIIVGGTSESVNECIDESYYGLPLSMQAKVTKNGLFPSTLQSITMDATTFGAGVSLPEVSTLPGFCNANSTPFTCVYAKITKSGMLALNLSGSVCTSPNSVGCYPPEFNVSIACIMNSLGSRSDIVNSSALSSSEIMYKFDNTTSSHIETISASGIQCYTLSGTPLRSISNYSLVTAHLFIRYSFPLGSVMENDGPTPFGYFSLQPATESVTYGYG